jgi:soluble lytic murein transglycosylase-like protein
MGRLFVCALFFSLVSTEAWTFTTDDTTDDLTPAALASAKTSFAYRVRHSWNPLPGPALSAMWFNGEDRDLPRETVAEPIVEPPAYTARPTPSRNALCSHAAAVATEHDLPVPFFANLIQQESGFKSHVVSPAGAQGIAQFMPGTAAERGLLNPFDPIQALPKSAEFLRELHGEFGNLGLAAAAYNAGPRRVREWLAGTGYMPSETRNYVQAITGASVEHWAKANANAKPGSHPDRSQHSGPGCGQLMAMLRRAPSPFMVALEHRVVLGVMRPWGVIVGADNSRDRMLVRYGQLQRRHSAALAGHDPILLDRRRGPLPRYQVRIGADTRTEANALCDRIHKSGGDCVVLRNPRT